MHVLFFKLFKNIIGEQSAFVDIIGTSGNVPV
jgi:hypothetical protein